jgi:hypothetical protein
MKPKLWRKCCLQMGGLFTNMSLQSSSALSICGAFVRNHITPQSAVYCHVSLQSSHFLSTVQPYEISLTFLANIAKRGVCMTFFTTPNERSGNIMIFSLQSIHSFFFFSPRLQVKIALCVARGLFVTNLFAFFIKFSWNFHVRNAALASRKVNTS